MGGTLPWGVLGPHHRVLYELEGYGLACAGCLIQGWVEPSLRGVPTWQVAGALYGGLEDGSQVKWGPWVCAHRQGWAEPQLLASRPPNRAQVR